MSYDSTNKLANDLKQEREMSQEEWESLLRLGDKVAKRLEETFAQNIFGEPCVFLSKMCDENNEQRKKERSTLCRLKRQSNALSTQMTTINTYIKKESLSNAKNSSELSQKKTKNNSSRNKNSFNFLTSNKNPFQNVMIQKTKRKMNKQKFCSELIQPFSRNKGNIKKKDNNTINPISKSKDVNKRILTNLYKRESDSSYKRKGILSNKVKRILNMSPRVEEKMTLSPLMTTASILHTEGSGLNTSNSIKFLNVKKILSCHKKYNSGF